MVLGGELSQRTHIEYSSFRDSTNISSSADMAALTQRSITTGRIMDWPCRVVASGLGRTLANRCAGRYLPWDFHPAGNVAAYEHGF